MSRAGGLIRILEVRWWDPWGGALRRSMHRCLLPKHQLVDRTASVAGASDLFDATMGIGAAVKVRAISGGQCPANECRGTAIDRRSPARLNLCNAIHNYCRCHQSPYDPSHGDIRQVHRAQPGLRDGLHRRRHAYRLVRFVTQRSP